MDPINQINLLDSQCFYNKKENKGDGGEGEAIIKLNEIKKCNNYVIMNTIKSIIWLLKSLILTTNMT